MRPRETATVCLILLAAAAACGRPAPTPLEVATERMLRSEGVLAAWSVNGQLNPLGQAFENLAFPAPAARHLFEDSILFLGLDESAPEAAHGPLEHALPGALEVVKWHPQAGEPARIAPQDMRLYSDLLSRVERFEYAKFKVHLPVPRWRDPATMHEWVVSLKFDARARLHDGRLAHVKGWSEVVWRLQPGSERIADPVEQDWRIVEWRCDSLKMQVVPGPMFEEVLARALPDADTLARARQSLHEQQVVQFLNDRGNFERPYLSWRPSAGEVHPSCAVADVDGDGLDDIYLQERLGRNLLLHNNGDGTFRDVAPEVGLDFDGMTASTLFLDLDNDGDLDAMVGGMLRRSMVLENVDGRFVDRSGDWVAEADLPFFVSGIAAADYDGDGLLDVHFSTYAANHVNSAIQVMRGLGSEMKGPQVEHLMRDYLAAEDFDRLHALMEKQVADFRVNTDRPGPPNVLLHNQGGGRLAAAGEGAEALRIFRNCYQSAWADVDGDGDPDLYCANDFAPNYMFENLGGGRFRDVTEPTGLADIGFGMGVTWADYDGDGAQDLYVTNMFSKAARRITSFFTRGAENFDEQLLGETSISPVYAALGAGNSLFRNPGADGGRWEKVSGMAAPKLVVEPGSWGWGAQFADFDNDGWPDIYAPAGYYTAPQEAAIAVDV